MHIELQLKHKKTNKNFQTSSLDCPTQGHHTTALTHSPLCGSNSINTQKYSYS